MGVAQNNFKQDYSGFYVGGDWRREKWEQGDQLACQGMRLELPAVGQQQWRQIGSVYFQEKVSKNFQSI